MWIDALADHGWILSVHQIGSHHHGCGLRVCTSSSGGGLLEVELVIREERSHHDGVRRLAHLFALVAGHGDLVLLLLIWRESWRHGHHMRRHIGKIVVVAAFEVRRATHSQSFLHQHRFLLLH